VAAVAGDRSPRDAWLIETVSRRQASLDDLERRADGALGWLGVQRQANSLVRHLASWSGSRWYDSLRPEMEAHHAHLLATQARAARELSAFDAATLDHASGRLGVRLALMGKGGAGKTVISSTLARLLGRRGQPVLAVDLDTNPGLAISLGLPATDAGLPPEAVVQQPGSAYGWALAPGLEPREVVDRYALEGPDGVSFLGMGKIGTTDKTHTRQSVVALLHVLLNFAEPGWHVIADMEAGPTSPFEHYHAFADDVLVVLGPAWRSGMTARRLLPMVGEGRTTTIVANRFRDEPDHPGLSPAIRIPFDPAVAEAERRGLPPLDACPDSPTITAIRQLAELFLDQEVRA